MGEFIVVKQPADEYAAHELALCATNNWRDLYRGTGHAIIRMLARCMTAGTYDHDKAVVAWRHYADAAAKRYCADYAGRDDMPRIFTPATRDLAAIEIRDYYDSLVREVSEGTSTL